VALANVPGTWGRNQMATGWLILVTIIPMNTLAKQEQYAGIVTSWDYDISKDSPVIESMTIEGPPDDGNW
jgi:hypothetical protein